VIGQKLPRAIRLDPSDTFVFEHAAEPGEWAVPGGFVFWQQDIGALAGKARSAFRAGFLGTGSLGWSTLAQVVNASEADRANAIESLATQLCAHYGAPNMQTARAAASEELNFTSSLADHPSDTLIALNRYVEDGEMREQFRTLRRREGVAPARAFAFMDVEGEEEPSEHVDLTSLAGTSPAREQR
jgi:hypothetical protein